MLATIAMLAVAVPLQARQLPPVERAPAVAGRFVAMQEREQQRPPGPADLTEAIEIALKRYGGQVSRADTVERDGRSVHEVRLLVDDVNVITVRIDPATGAIIPQERDQD
jgi:uncharacterized membrane protein YkoI